MYKCSNVFKEAPRGHLQVSCDLLAQWFFTKDMYPPVTVRVADHRRNTRHCTAMLQRKDILVWLNLKAYVTCRGYLYPAATSMRDLPWQDGNLSFRHVGGRLVKLGFNSYRKVAIQTGFIYRVCVGWWNIFQRLAVVVGPVDGWISLLSTSYKIDGKELHGQDWNTTLVKPLLLDWWCFCCSSTFCRLGYS